MNSLMRIVFLVALLAITIMFRGYTLSTLWGWFAVPYGLTAISIPLAIGFYCIFNMLQIIKRSEKDSGITTEGALFPFIWGGMMLLVGYFAKMFM
jgi:hypothetical protein